MKTVGIITYHHFYNYGTMLQALALQKSIEKLGYSAEMIDYIQDERVSKRQLLKARIMSIPSYCLHFKHYYLKRKARKIKREEYIDFESFYASNLNIGKIKYRGYEELKNNPPLYDGYVVGSDQTWNPYVSNCPKGNYLTFVNDDSKKGSYAPSLPITEIPVGYRGFMRDELSKFAYLSCREEVGANLISDLTGRSVKHVLDPTLLFASKEWDEFADKSFELPSKPYILVYLLGHNKKHRKIIKEIANKSNTTVLYLPMSYPEILNKKIDKAKAGPAQFLNLVKNAKMVLTDSYHGTLFAINYNKDFYSFTKFSDTSRFSENYRLYNVLGLLGLQDRLINSRVFKSDLTSIDYSAVNEKLDRLRTDSLEYLGNMLEAITE